MDTVYFGGGTPSFYGEKRLTALLKQIKKQYQVDKQAEITLEANPDSVDPKMLTRLRKAGFNRISLGVQSADDGQLASLAAPTPLPRPVRRWSGPVRQSLQISAWI